MTRQTLYEILKTVMAGKLDESEFNSMFEPAYRLLPFDEQILKQEMKRAIVFDYQQLGITFRTGRVSCSGIEIVMDHPRFKEIRLSIFASKGVIYNAVLALPSYTETDYRGKKTITLIASEVRSTKDMHRLMQKMYKRFECPEIITENQL